MIKRQLEQTILSNLYKGKALIILGPRQVGKSTLLNIISDGINEKPLFLNCDNNDIRKQLTDVNISDLKRIVGNHKIVFIDEAQRVLNIGLTLKILSDQMPEVQIVVTGSSALELSNLVNEPLTGRKFEYQLFPLSVNELIDHIGFLETKRQLNHYMIYGTYPDVINNSGNEPEILNNLAGSYLYKDIFLYQDIRKPEFIEQLLEALALQVSSEVSYNELAQLLNTDSHTVQRYIGLLERAYVIFRLRSFSRNARNEIKKSRKIYFYDNGIRNAILNNYSLLGSRTDAGALWENFFISERMKFLSYNKVFCKKYFWRTTQKQEIDYIEEHNGKLLAFEIKINTKKTPSIPLTFKRNYPESEFYVINPDNFFDFVNP